MATKAPVYKVIPTIELQASDVDYSNQLDAALFLSKFDHLEICLVSNDGRQIFCNRSLLSIFSNSIRNILDSSIAHQIPDITPIIIVPDCSGDSISKVHDILLNGSTRCSITSFHDINNVIETAKALGIEMKDLGFVPFSSLEQRRPIPQPKSKPAFEPVIPYKVTIPQPETVDVKKENVDDEDISVVGFAGDPNKAIPLNIKVENKAEKLLSDFVNEKPVTSGPLNNGVSLKHKKKKKKHLKPTNVDQLNVSPKDAISIRKDRKSEGRKENIPIFESQIVQNIRPSTIPSSSKAKKKSHFTRPESVDEYRPLSAKSVEVNKIHHARIAEMSDEELAFTSNKNYFTPPYTKTSITNNVQEDEEMTVVSPDFFEETEEGDKPNDYENKPANNHSGEVKDFFARVERKKSDNSAVCNKLSNDQPYVNDSFHVTDIEVKTVVKEQLDVSVEITASEEVAVSYVEEEISQSSENDIEIGSMKPLAEVQDLTDSYYVTEEVSSESVKGSEAGPIVPLVEKLVSESVDNTDNVPPASDEAHMDQSSDEDFAESGLNDSSYYTDYMDLKKIQAEENVSEKKVFYGFSDVSTSVKDGQILTKINPSEFGEESNDSVHRESEIEDVELQIRQLEQELDSTMDNEATEEPAEVEVPKNYEFPDQQPPAGEDSFSSDDDDDDFFVEVPEVKALVDIQLESNVDHPTSDTSSSLLVDNYLNHVIEKDMKETVYKDTLNVEVKENLVEEQNSSLDVLNAANESKELEKIFGEGAEELHENINNGSLPSGNSGNSDEVKAEEQTILKNLFVNNPSDKLVNLIGNNSISIGRTNDKSKKIKPERSEYNSLRIERVKCRDPKPDNTEHTEYQPASIERVSSNEKIKSKPKLESWTTGRRSSRSSGKSSPYSTEFQPREELSPEVKPTDETVTELLKGLVPEKELEPTAFKRDRSKSPCKIPILASLPVDNSLEMSIAKRSKRIEKSGEVKASNLDLQISKLKQTYAAPSRPNMEVEMSQRIQQEVFSSPSVENQNMSAMTFSQLSKLPAPNPHMNNDNIEFMNHACVVCGKSDWGGSVSSRIAVIKTHYSCVHFRQEILDLYKNEMRGNICLVDGCKKTILDTKDSRPNITRHIGSSHSKIYKILKLRGHKLEFLKPKDEKSTRSRENRPPSEARVTPEARVVRTEIIPKPTNEKKASGKSTAGKIECNFCTRKYSNNFNLRKHILAAHDKMLD